MQRGFDRWVREPAAPAAPEAVQAPDQSEVEPAKRAKRAIANVPVETEGWKKLVCTFGTFAWNEQLGRLDGHCGVEGHEKCRLNRQLRKGCIGLVTAWLLATHEAPATRSFTMTSSRKICRVRAPRNFERAVGRSSKICARAPARMAYASGR